MAEDPDSALLREIERQAQEAERRRAFTAEFDRLLPLRRAHKLLDATDYKIIKAMEAHLVASGLLPHAFVDQREQAREVIRAAKPKT